MPTDSAGEPLFCHPLNCISPVPSCARPGSESSDVCASRQAGCWAERAFSQDVGPETVPTKCIRTDAQPSWVITAAGTATTTPRVRQSIIRRHDQQPNWETAAMGTAPVNPCPDRSPCDRSTRRSLRSGRLRSAAFNLLSILILAGSSRTSPPPGSTTSVDARPGESYFAPSAALRAAMIGAGSTFQWPRTLSSGA
jgi:hypothetical protein